MTGREYEYAVARYLRWHGFSRTKVTQSSGDYGVDVIAVRRRERYAVQCKYYGHPVGLSAVQEAVAGMAAYDCGRAMVVTNTTFTRAARQLAEQNGVELWERVEPVRHAPPCPPVLRVLIALLWSGGIVWYLLPRSRQLLSMGDPVRSLLAAALLLLPLWLIPAARLFRWCWWRIGLRRETRREQKASASAERTSAMLDDLVRAAAELKGTKGTDAFRRGKGRVDTHAVCAGMKADAVLRRSLCRLAQERSLTLARVQTLTGLSRKDALILADCMICAGWWLCTRPLHYAWTAQATGG